MTTYIHNAVDQVLYEHPDEPTLVEAKDGRGNRTHWAASLQIQITRSDNQLVNGQWKHAVMDPRHVTYPPHYTRAQAIAAFRLRHEPNGEAISQQEFARLKTKYEEAAREQRET